MSSSQIPDRPPFKAFIRNLDFKTESQDVEEFLAGCRLVEFHAFTDRDTGRAKGYGILEFEDRYGYMFARLARSHSPPSSCAVAMV